VIKEEQIGDYDRLVTLLTAEQGVLRAFATGARRVKSKKISSTALFAYSSFSLTEKKGTYRITEAEPIEIFFNLRQNIVRMALASYFCSVINFLAPKEEDAKDLLRLTLNSFYLISKGDVDERLIKAIFEYRIITESGYMADLSACANCGADADEGFLSMGGDFYCRDCGTTQSGLYPVNKSIFKALNYIAESDISNLFSFKLSRENVENLNLITEKYLEYQSEHQFKTLDFYKSLL
jgi:DNA repair protein RecO (recombination protein O)